MRRSRFPLFCSPSLFSFSSARIRLPMPRAPSASPTAPTPTTPSCSTHSPRGRSIPASSRYVHELSDIESLNQRARRAELEVTAVSIHAYAYIWREYALLGSGSSMGDGYGPRLVSTKPRPGDPRAALRGRRIARSRPAHDRLSRAPPLPAGIHGVVMPFDRIEEAVHAGEVDVGLLIHEGQLTYADAGLHLWADLGAWWLEDTGLPLPLGGNAVRRDLGAR